MSGGECMRLLCPDALNGRPHWHTRPASAEPDVPVAYDGHGAPVYEHQLDPPASAEAGGVEHDIWWGYLCPALANIGALKDAQREFMTLGTDWAEAGRILSRVQSFYVNAAHDASRRYVAAHPASEPEGDRREWLIEAEDGTRCQTSEDVARKVATGAHGYTVGIDRSPVAAAFARATPDDEWTPLAEPEGDRGVGKNNRWTCGGCGYEGNGPDNVEWTEHTKVCPDLHPATPDAGDAGDKTRALNELTALILPHLHPASDELDAGVVAAVVLSCWTPHAATRARDEERAAWSSWLDNWMSAVGPEPPTVAAVATWLRADQRPFGTARGDS